MVAKPSEKSEKEKGKDPYGQRNHEGKKKDQGWYKGPNKLTLEELESYQKENKWFWCGEQGHVNRQCPKRPSNGKKEAIEASTVMLT